MNEETDLKTPERRALAYIRNRLVHDGVSPSVRQVAEHLGYRSPRTAAQVLDRLIEAGFIKRRDSDKSLQLLRLPDENIEQSATVDVPLVGTAPCGLPLLAMENYEAVIPVSERLAKPPHKYFLLRANGGSMNNAGIEDGALVLVRQQQVADNGDVVVALINDEATIKELRIGRDVVALVPRSTNKDHQPIIVTSDFLIQGVVVASLPDISDV
jgi:repressor LexA